MKARLARARKAIIARAYFRYYYTNHKTFIDVREYFSPVHFCLLQCQIEARVSYTIAIVASRRITYFENLSLPFSQLTKLKDGSGL